MPVTACLVVIKFKCSTTPAIFGSGVSPYVSLCCAPLCHAGRCNAFSPHRLMTSYVELSLGRRKAINELKELRVRSCPLASTCRAPQFQHKHALPYTVGCSGAPSQGELARPVRTVAVIAIFCERALPAHSESGNTFVLLCPLPPLVDRYLSISPAVSKTQVFFLEL